MPKLCPWSKSLTENKSAADMANMKLSPDKDLNIVEPRVLGSKAYPLWSSREKANNLRNQHSSWS